MAHLTVKQLAPDHLLAIWLYISHSYEVNNISLLCITKIFGDHLVWWFDKSLIVVIVKFNISHLDYKYGIISIEYSK